ncbi:hypothetical protein ACFQ36_02500 [Arthrobacter sp. GCM10027362]
MDTEYARRDGDGITFHLFNGEVSPGLAKMPDDEDGLYSLGPACGRIYDDRAAAQKGEAPGVKTVGVKSGPVAGALRIHWDARRLKHPSQVLRQPCLRDIFLSGVRYLPWGIWGARWGTDDTDGFGVGGRGSTAVRLRHTVHGPGSPGRMPGGQEVVQHQLA